LRQEQLLLSLATNLATHKQTGPAHYKLDLCLQYMQLVLSESVALPLGDTPMKNIFIAGNYVYFKRKYIVLYNII